MILNIETIERHKIKLNDQEFETENQSVDILILIEKYLKENGKTLKDIESILVNCGPGSFTGVRVGITVANTLAWSLNIPVIGYRDGDISKAKSEIQTENKFSKIALPSYSK